MSAQLLEHEVAGDAAWDEVSAEFGLFTVRGTASLLRLSTFEVEALLAAGNILWVYRDGDILVPGFQFHDGRLLTVVGELVLTARSAACTLADLALWLCTATPAALDGQRPVEVLRSAPDAVVSAARSALARHR